jgi:hypothetical protein
VSVSVCACVCVCVCGGGGVGGNCSLPGRAGWATATHLVRRGKVACAQLVLAVHDDTEAEGDEQRRQHLQRRVQTEPMLVRAHIRRHVHRCPSMRAVCLSVSPSE